LIEKVVEGTKYANVFDTALNRNIKEALELFDEFESLFSVKLRADGKEEKGLLFSMVVLYKFFEDLQLEEDRSSVWIINVTHVRNVIYDVIYRCIPRMFVFEGGLEWWIENGFNFKPSLLKVHSKQVFAFFLRDDASLKLRRPVVKNMQNIVRTCITSLRECKKEIINVFPDTPDGHYVQTLIGDLLYGDSDWSRTHTMNHECVVCDTLGIDRPNYMTSFTKHSPQNTSLDSLFGKSICGVCFVDELISFEVTNFEKRENSLFNLLLAPTLRTSNFGFYTSSS